MAYITYEDLCDQFTSKYIDDTFKDVDIINRERIITLFSAEVESWANKTLTPLKIFQPSSLRLTVQEMLACSVFDKIVGIRLMMRKFGNNGNTALMEQLEDVKNEIEKIYNGKLPMQKIPTTAEYQAGDRNTKRVVGF